MIPWWADGTFWGTILSSGAIAEVITALSHCCFRWWLFPLVAGQHHPPCFSSSLLDQPLLNQAHGRRCQSEKPKPTGLVAAYFLYQWCPPPKTIMHKGKVVERPQRPLTIGWPNFRSYFFNSHTRRSDHFLAWLLCEIQSRAHFTFHLVSSCNPQPHWESLAILQIEDQKNHAKFTADLVWVCLTIFLRLLSHMPL